MCAGLIDTVHLRFSILIREPRINDNPYSYISQADLIVNTSISEAAPNVINEALILHVPVICTNFGSAKEYVDNDKNGYIVPIEKIAEKVELLIKNISEYNRIKKRSYDV